MTGSRVGSLGGEQVLAGESAGRQAGLGLDGAMIFGRTRDRNTDEPEVWPVYQALRQTISGS
jgi:hypothetical protein